MESGNENHNLLARIVRGVAANGFALVVTLLSSLVSVAFFFRAWGVDLYGEWVILSAVPTYLTMSDLSFGTTAGSEMTMLVAQGKRLEALRLLQTAWLLVTALSVSIVALMLVAIRFLPLSTLQHFSILSNREATSVLTILLLSVCLSQQGGLIDACYKCSGYYAKGIFMNNLLRLVEFLAGVAVLVFKGDPWMFAWTMVVPKAIAYVIFWSFLRRKVPWLHFGWSYADKRVIRPLVSPALTFNAFNLGYALSLQGIILLIGARGAPADTAVFEPLRKITRVLFQGASAIANTIWVELSTAIGRNDYETARKLHRRASQISLWIVIPGVVVLLFIGPPLFAVMTNGARFSYPVFWSLLVVTVLGSVWTISYVVPLSINKHQSTALTFIVTATGTLFLANVLMGSLGVLGATYALIVGEAVMVAFVLRRSLGLLHDHWRPFLAQMLTPPYDLVQRLLDRRRSSPPNGGAA